MAGISQRQRELTDLLKKAAESYYAKDMEIMSNFEYDELYDELVKLEEDSGITLAGSPTVNVGYAAVDALPKQAHEQAMLSLDKTKDREMLRDWLNGETGLLSWKMDGLTVVLTYDDGALTQAVTRGNGEIGEVITNNARTFINLPLHIPYKGHLTLRGEAVISYSDFEQINEEIEAKALAENNPGELGYKNPRNLCSGSVRQLNSAVTARRRVQFYAFALVEAAGVDMHNSHAGEFEFLRAQGFDVVEYHKVTSATILDEIQRYEDKISTFDLPSDGLVLLLDDIRYGASLGRTAKFPRNAIAFKWQDEQKETTLRGIEWSASRTGLINPVAIFDPVDLEGTSVKRASLHNISICRQLKLGLGDKLVVYKANMIIPQIARNLTESDTLVIPYTCPVCGEPTKIRNDNGSESLYCPNPDCAAKKVKSFALFVSRNAMNIDGLSEMSLEKLIGAGLIHEFADIFKLNTHRAVIENMDGFGEKSYEKLVTSIRTASNTTPERVLCALGIPGVGVNGAKLLCRAYKGDLNAIRSADETALSEIDGIGPVMADAIVTWFADETNSTRFDRLLECLTIDSSAFENAGEGHLPLEGKTFVITGSVNHFKNRSELKNLIESLGGKATGSVSKKTDYLINNDVNSGSSKNRKARELGVPILSEEDFLSLTGVTKED